MPDEASSALDTITAGDIAVTILEISRSRQQMVTLVAHRLSGIMRGDPICVFEKMEGIGSRSHE